MGKKVKKIKRRKKKTVVMILLVVILLLGTGGAGYCYVQQQSEDEEIEVGENQTLVIAHISQINGNEISFQEAEEVDFSERTEKKAERDKKTGTDSQKDASEQDNATEGTSPGDASGENMPGGGNPPGDSSGENMPGEGNSSGGSSRENTSEGGMSQGDSTGGKKSDGDVTEDATQDQKVYTIVGEEQTMLIPVGTSVTTSMGTVTTFSRLAAGDMVKLLMETDASGELVIVGVWMLE